MYILHRVKLLLRLQEVCITTTRVKRDAKELNDLP